MSISQPLPPRTPLVGGKYRLREVIGSGGVGTVYRATHLWTEREVAVKVLDPSLPHFHQLRDAFLMEARATVQLQHPNVVEVLDMGEDEAGTTYMVMELLDGPTLREVLSEQGRLSAQDTANILLPLMDALDKAHEMGIVHKDFKPENIILSIDASEFMTPKLLDFGVAQVLRETQPRGSGAPDDVIVGTPQYMSPEQARDERDLIGPQTDVWGVGVVWYECLTGRSLFDRETPTEVLKAVCDAPIDFAELPESQAAILRPALERSTRRRTQRLSDLMGQIAESGLASLTTTDDPAVRSSRPPALARPRYARRTLDSAGSSGPRPVQFDSELLTLPKNTNRRAMLGGLALAIAVGLSAWWTIDESRPLDAPNILEEPTAEATRPDAWEVTEPTQAPEVTQSDLAEPTRAEAIAEPEQVSAATDEATPSEATEELTEDATEELIEEAAIEEATEEAIEEATEEATEELMEVEDSSPEQAEPVKEDLPDPPPRAAPKKAARKASTPKTPSVRRPVEPEVRAPAPPPQRAQTP